GHQSSLLSSGVTRGRSAPSDRPVSLTLVRCAGKASRRIVEHPEYSLLLVVDDLVVSLDHVVLLGPGRLFRARGFGGTGLSRRLLVLVHRRPGSRVGGVQPIERRLDGVRITSAERLLARFQ